MALDFPSNPVDGQVYGSYIYNAAKNAWQGGKDSATVAVVSSTVPASANNGDVWYNSALGIAYVYYYDGNSGQWVELTSPAPEVPTINSIDDIANVNASAPTDGNALIFDTATSAWIPNKDTEAIKMNVQTISANYAIPSGYNGMSAGPITIANGVTVTIPDGSSWSIV